MADIICHHMAEELEKQAAALRKNKKKLYASLNLPATAREALTAGWTQNEFGWQCPACTAAQVAQEELDRQEEADSISGGTINELLAVGLAESFVAPSARAVKQGVKEKFLTPEQKAAIVKGLIKENN